jgi:hypothetical protein
MIPCEGLLEREGAFGILERGLVVAGEAERAG